MWKKGTSKSYRSQTCPLSEDAEQMGQRSRLIPLKNDKRDIQKLLKPQKKSSWIGLGVRYFRRDNAKSFESVNGFVKKNSHGTFWAQSFFSQNLISQRWIFLISHQLDNLMLQPSKSQIKDKWKSSRLRIISSILMKAFQTGVPSLLDQKEGLFIFMREKLLKENLSQLYTAQSLGEEFQPFIKMMKSNGLKKNHAILLIKKSLNSGDSKTSCNSEEQWQPMIRSMIQQFPSLKKIELEKKKQNCKPQSSLFQCYQFSIDEFLAEDFHQDKQFDLIKKICSLLNQCEGYLVFGHKKLNQESKQTEQLEGFYINQINLDQMEQIQTLIRQILKERIIPRTAKAEFEYVNIGNQFQIQKFKQIPGMPTINTQYPEQQLLVVNLKARNKDQLHAVVHRKSNFKHTYEVYIQDKMNRPAMPVSSDEYELTQKIYKLQHWSKKSQEKKQKRIKLILSTRSIFYQETDQNPSIIFKYNFILILGSRAKQWVIGEAKKKLNAAKVRLSINKPYEKYCVNSPKVIYSINADENFGQVERVLKEDDTEKLFHSLIVVTNYLSLDLRFRDADKICRCLQNTLKNRFPGARYWKVPQKNHPNIFEVYYQFEGVPQTLFAFCLMVNENIKARFIRKNQFENYLQEFKHSSIKFHKTLKSTPL